MNESERTSQAEAVKRDMLYRALSSPEGGLSLLRLTAAILKDGCAYVRAGHRQDLAGHVRCLELLLSVVHSGGPDREAALAVLTEAGEARFSYPQLDRPFEPVRQTVRILESYPPIRDVQPSVFAASGI